MEELIQRIVAKVGVDESVAKSAVSVIMSFLHKEGPSEKVEQLASQIGGDNLLGQADGDTGSTKGGMMASMMGGGAMAVLGELQGLGLDMGEIQGVTQETISFAKEKGGEDVVNEIVSAIPGLSQFI